MCACDRNEPRASYLFHTMMLTLHFYRVYPVINSSMGDIGGKDMSRLFRILEFFSLEIIGDLRPNFFLSSFHEGGGGKKYLLAHRFGQKYRRINFSSRGGMRTILTKGGGGGGGCTHTHTCAEHTRLHRSVFVRKRRSHSRHLLADC